MTKKRGDSHAAVLPPVWDLADIAAMQSLAKGEATPDQQKRAIDWWITKCAGTYDLSYRPGDTHETAFAEGRRFCGLQAVKLLKLNIAALKRSTEWKI